MRLPTRGRRITAVAGALLATALLAPFAAQATETDAPRRPADTAAGTAADTSEPRQYEVRGVRTVAERTALTTTGASIDAVRRDSVVVTADARQLDAVRTLGHEVTALAGPPERGGPSLKAKAGAADFPADDARFHTYAEMNEAIDKAVAAHPDILSKQVIGKSHEGRDMIAVKLSDKVGTDEAEPEVLFTHHQHAREHLTVEMALYLIEEFSSKYGSDEAITEAVDGREIWILPDLNPDGGEYDLTGGEYQMWRKNRQPDEATGEIGTDENRNWDFKWGCCGGSSGNPAAETYRGPAASSAPEVKSVSDFVHSRIVDGKQQIKAAIDFHTYGELVMWPWGWTGDEVTDGMTQDDIDTFKTVGKDMAASNGYTPQQSSELYVTDGAVDDYLWGDQKIFAYTYEMYPGDSGSGGFYPPDEVIEKETSRNREAVLKLLGNADCMYRAIGKEEQYCGSGSGSGSGS